MPTSPPLTGGKGGAPQPRDAGSPAVHADTSVGYGTRPYHIIPCNGLPESLGTTEKRTLVFPLASARSGLMSK